jgi:hypothetical protein
MYVYKYCFDLILSMPVDAENGATSHQNLVAQRRSSVQK